MMRPDRFVLATAMILSSGAVRAQEQAVDQPAAIVCQLLANCDSADQPAEDAAPRQSGAPRTGATRSFSFKGTKPAGASPGAQGNPVSGKLIATNKPPGSPGQQPGQYELRVTFMFGSAEVNPASLGQITAFATALRDPRLAGRKVRIEGHTDSIGTADANLGLSDRRARAISELIAAAGIEESRLDVRGYGASRPIPGLPTTAGENRRVIAVLAN